MPHHKIARMTGISPDKIYSPADHHPPRECAHMNDHDMRQFMREEQAEGSHPSLKRKHF